MLADPPLQDLVRAWTTTTVHVATPRAADLAALLAGPAVEIATASAVILAHDSGYSPGGGAPHPRLSEH